MEALGSLERGDSAKFGQSGGDEKLNKVGGAIVAKTNVRANEPQQFEARWTGRDDVFRELGRATMNRLETELIARRGKYEGTERLGEKGPFALRIARWLNAVGDDNGNRLDKRL